MIPKQRASPGKEEEKEKMRKLGQESESGSFRHSLSTGRDCTLKDLLTKCRDKLQRNEREPNLLS